MTVKELYREAQELFLKGKHKESINVFTKAIGAGEKTEIVYLSRGAALLKEKEYDKAIADFGKVIELNDQNQRVYYYRGIAHMLNKNIEKSIPDFDKAIDLNPDNSAAFFARGTAYAELGNDDDAAKNIKTALMNAETAIQGFSDTFGVLRTHFERALTLMTGERKPPSIELTDEETEKLKKWLEE
jgi:tetratricopeptide (TPR) repeat protein